jgi:hypothetical protein
MAIGFVDECDDTSGRRAANQFGLVLDDGTVVFFTLAQCVFGKIALGYKPKSDRT